MSEYYTSYERLHEIYWSDKLVLFEMYSSTEHQIRMILRIAPVPLSLFYKCMEISDY